MTTPKSLNYFPTVVTVDYSLPANKYNAVFATASAPITITLPLLEDVLQGFLLMIKNEGSANVEVNYQDGSSLTTLTPNDTVELLADSENDIWKITLGPIGGASGGGSVTGPAGSTNNAIATWNGLSGTLLNDSGILISGGTLTSASGNLSISSASGTINLNGAALINVGSITLGNQKHIEGSRVVISGASSSILLTVPTTSNNSYSVYLTINAVNDSNFTDSYVYTAMIRLKNVSGTLTRNIYGVQVSCDNSLTGIAISTAFSGTNMNIVATGIGGITTAYLAVADVDFVAF